MQIWRRRLDLSMTELTNLRETNALRDTTTKQLIDDNDEVFERSILISSIRFYQQNSSYHSANFMKGQKHLL